MPPDGHMKATGVYVSITRFTSLEDVFLLLPLWNNDAQRRKYIDSMNARTRIPYALSCDLKRLAELAKQTRTKVNMHPNNCADV